MADTDLTNSFLSEQNNFFIVNFGDVEVFKKYRKTVEIPLSKKIKKNFKYTIKKIDCQKKQLSESFSLVDKSVRPMGDTLKLIATYKPIVSNQFNSETYEYSSNSSDSNHCIRIKLKGRALGPQCTMSTKRLTFYNSNPEMVLLQKKIEIINSHPFKALYKFANNANDGIFEVHPSEGYIKGNSCQYITITFKGFKIGHVYYKQLYCLIWHSYPLAVELIGYSAQLPDNKLQNAFPLKAQDYFENKIQLKNGSISLHTNYIDFGRVLCSNKNEVRTIILKDNMEESVTIEWQTGSQFQIDPTSLRIADGESRRLTKFECHFIPNESNEIFFEELRARIWWRHLTVDNIPIVYLWDDACMLKLGGHSFPEHEEWLVSVQIIPELVVFVPCVPGTAVTSTIQLQNKTHLPALYKLIPPCKTNVTAKPMMGKLIKFDIIALKLQTDEDSVEKLYVEKWKIIINDRQDKPLIFYVKGKSSVPCIEIASGNKIFMHNIQEGSEIEYKIPMKNLSDYDISYNFDIKKESRLNIYCPKGTLFYDDQITIDMKLRADSCSSNKETLICWIYGLDANGAIVDNVYEFEVDIVFNCLYSQLCAFPRREDLGIVECGIPFQASFDAFNFGQTTIYIRVDVNRDNTDLIDKTSVEINPSIAQVEPMSKIQFQINCTTKNREQHTIQIVYYNMTDKISMRTIGCPIDLFQITFISSLPVLQIEGITDHNFGLLFKNNHFENNFLNISKLNETLRSVEIDETKEIYVTFPECEVDENKTYFIDMILNNTTSFETTIEFKRKKLCECPIIEINEGNTRFHRRKKSYDCPHRKILYVDVSDRKFFGYTHRVLTIQANFHIAGETSMCYIMKLSCNRTIEIYFKLFSIPLESPAPPRISSYLTEQNFKITLQQIYIGTKIAPVQIFWMYNNTRSDINFECDLDEIHLLCDNEGFDIFEILNPIIQFAAHSSRPLLIKFHPIEARNYSVHFRVNLTGPTMDNTDTIVFALEGLGIIDESNLTMNYRKKQFDKHYKNEHLSLSIDYIDLRNLTIWERRQENAVIKNNSSDKIFQFTFEEIKIDKIIEIYVDKPCGILLPKQVCTVSIVIQVYEKPVKSTLLLSCKALNYTEMFLHKLTMDKYLIEARKKEDEFIINEKGTEQIKNPIKIHPKPEIKTQTIELFIETRHPEDLNRLLKNEEFLRCPNVTRNNLIAAVPQLCNTEKDAIAWDPFKSNSDTALNGRQQMYEIFEEIIEVEPTKDAFKMYLKRLDITFPCMIFSKSTKTANQKLQETANIFDDTTNLESISLSQFYGDVVPNKFSYGTQIDFKLVNNEIIKNLLNSCSCPCRCSEDT